MNINWTGKVAVGVAIAVAVTLVNQGGRIAFNAVDENAWDDEVQKAIAPVKRVVEPIVRSTQSLAIDRKILVRDRKVAILENVVAVKKEDRTDEQQRILDDATDGIKKMDKEIAQLEEEYKLPVFAE